MILDYILLVKYGPDEAWTLHDTSFYTLADAQQFARELIDTGVCCVVSIGEAELNTNNPPVFNLTYCA